MPWTPLSSREALLRQKIGRCADQDSASTSADTFYNTHELGLLSDDALESWVTDQLNSMPEPLPGLPMRELSESEHYDTESLGWLKDNARTAEDKAALVAATSLKPYVAEFENFIKEIGVSLQRNM